jgi:hypothetical protein
MIGPVYITIERFIQLANIQYHEQIKYNQKIFNWNYDKFTNRTIRKTEMFT